MVQWSSRKSVIKLNSGKFSTYVRSAFQNFFFLILNQPYFRRCIFRSKPRNYSVIVMFTALNPKRGCSVCQEASDEFTILANSFRFSSMYSHNLFFGVVDFDDGSEVFQSVCI